MVKVSFIIANWNGEEVLSLCLESIISTIAHSNQVCEIIVVDNGSVDKSLEVIGKFGSQVQLIKNASNLGFATANNQAFSAAKGEFIATVNNDIILDINWLIEMISVIESDTNCASTASCILFLDSPNTINSTGIRIDQLGVAHDRDEFTFLGVSEISTDVFGPSAGAAVYRRAALEKVGFFEDSFFAYYEDVDLAWRLRRAGWSSKCAVNAISLHRYSFTSSKYPRMKMELISRNHLLTFLRNTGSKDLFRLLPRLIIVELISAIFQIYNYKSFKPLTKRIEAIFLFIKGPSDDLGHLPISELELPQPLWNRYNRWKKRRAARVTRED